MILPAQVVVGPVIGKLETIVSTRTTAHEVAVPQRSVNLYLTVSNPCMMPYTLPALSTVSIAWFTLLQVPPVTEEARDVVLPTQTEVVPLIVPANKVSTRRLAASDHVVPLSFVAPHMYI